MRLIVSLLLLTCASGLVARATPGSESARFVSDPKSVLSPDAKQALDRVLVEHAELTDEWIGLSLVDDTAIETRFDELTRDHEGGDAALIALSTDDQQIQIKVGYGLASKLNDDELDHLKKLILTDENKSSPDHEAVVVVIAVLKALQSPLVDTGKVDSELGRFLIHSRGVSDSSMPSILIVFVFVVGAGIFVLVILLLLGSDAVYTAQGWRPTSLLERLRLSLPRSSPNKGRQKFEGVDGSW